MRVLWLLWVGSGWPGPDSGDSWNPPRMSLEEPAGSGLAFTSNAQAWYAIPTGWLYITRGSRPGTATRMDIESDIALDPTVSPIVEARLGVAAHHGFGLRFADLDSEGTGTVDEPFIYHGETFAAGREVHSELDILTLEGDYQYTFNPEDDFRVTAHLGGQYWKFSARLNTADAGPPISTQRAFDSAFWMAGVDLHWQVTDGVVLRMLAVGGYERSAQYFFKVEADALFRVSGPLSITAGYRFHRLRFYQSTNQSDLRTHGPTLGLEVSF